MKSLGLWEYFLMLITLASIGAALYFANHARELQARVDRGLLIEHSGRGEEIRIIHRGEVVSEWEPRDGEIYQLLDESLHEN